jgi:hypothetical protein
MSQEQDNSPQSTRKPGRNRFQETACECAEQILYCAGVKSSTSGNSQESNAGDFCRLVNDLSGVAEAADRFSAEIGVVI